jgi:hypothetical protein
MPRCPACPISALPDATRCAHCGATFAAPRWGLFEQRLSKSDEAQVHIPNAAVVTLGLLGIGGGAWGMGAACVLLVSMPFRPGIALVYGVAIALYVFGIWCGVQMFQRRAGWLRQNAAFWCLQIPAFGSPIITYSFASGAMFNLWIRLLPTEVGFEFWLGSKFQFFFSYPKPWTIGVNVVALVIALYLLKLERSKMTAPNVEAGSS